MCVSGDAEITSNVDGTGEAMLLLLLQVFAVGGHRLQLAGASSAHLQALLLSFRSPFPYSFLQV
jgi:hypothetical protein